MKTAAHARTDPPLTDAEMASRVAAGDQAAFRLLMRRHNQAMFRTARSILRDDAEAEDAVQEATSTPTGASRTSAGIRSSPPGSSASP